MTIGEKLDWNEVEKIGIGALVASTVASVWAYFRSIGQKASKTEVEKQLSDLKAGIDKHLSDLRAEFDKQIESVNRRHSNWEAKSEQFATREMVDALNAKFERMESRFDAHFEKINTRLDKFIEGHR